MAPPTTEYFIELLEEGAEAWNTWRNENIGVHPDLSEVDLSELDLEGVNLESAQVGK